MMPLRLSIKAKVFAWNVLLVLVFAGVLLTLLFSIREISQLTSEIVNHRYMVDSLSKNLMDHILVMEESQRKYALVKGRQYIEAYMAALRKFEQDLAILTLMDVDSGGHSVWSSLRKSYDDHFRSRSTAVSAASQGAETSPAMQWIPQQVLDEWINSITLGRAKNQKAIEEAVRSLHVKGEKARGWVIIAAVAALIICITGWVFLAHSINRPLKELRRGILSLSREGPLVPINIRTRDEFEDLAKVFNSMARRLRREEKMRADFISMLSHEIRTPLTSITEAVNLLSEEIPGPINDRQRRLLEISRRELERITKQLAQLIQISRLEAGTLEVKPVEIPVDELVSSSMDRLLPMAQSKGVHLRCEIPSGIPRVYADPEHLLQVLVNLIGNAIKFSPKGSTVSVGVTYIESSKELCFYVSDQGPGIPEEEKDKVFERYYRVSSMAEDTDGMGLGLSISKGLVERHGGSIWVESSPGRGSTFYFTISACGRKGS
jgi:signal transduction histidine kinase